MGILHIGEKSSNGQVTIVDEDRLCYIVRSESKGSVGLRTISKKLLQEFVDYKHANPYCTSTEAREALSGKSNIDKYEYGYCSTLTIMAAMIIDKEKAVPVGDIQQENQEHFPLQVIYYGAPGTGKSNKIKVLMNKTNNKEVIRTTFHPDSDYSTFVGAYKPTTIDVPVMTVIGTNAVPVKDPNGNDRTEKKIVYNFVPQAFLQAYVNAWKLYMESDGENIDKQYLIIEEINRGNCAQIFGDLFQLLDRNENGFSDYPINADKDIENYLSSEFEEKSIPKADDLANLFKDPQIAQKIQQGKILVLPPNLYIWATMNTSDQSLFPIDSAFKRRWDWKYVPIDEGRDQNSKTKQPLGWKIHADGKEYDWWEFILAINKEIGEMTNLQDKKLGYFFCKAKNNIIDAETFVNKVLFYLWNEVLKDSEDEQKILDDGKGGHLEFEQFYKSNLQGETEIVEANVAKLLENLGLEGKAQATEQQNTEAVKE